MELTFEIKDLIYIAVLLVSIVIAWQQLKSHVEKQDIAMSTTNDKFGREMDMLKKSVKHLYEDNNKDHESYEKNMNVIKGDIHRMQQDIALMQQSLEVMKQGQADMMKILLEKK